MQYIDDKKETRTGKSVCSFYTMSTQNTIFPEKKCQSCDGKKRSCSTERWDTFDYESFNQLIRRYGNGKKTSIIFSSDKVDDFVDDTEVKQKIVGLLKHYKEKGAKVNYVTREELTPGKFSLYEIYKEVTIKNKNGEEISIPQAKILEYDGEIVRLHKTNQDDDRKCTTMGDVVLGTQVMHFMNDRSGNSIRDLIFITKDKTDIQNVIESFPSFNTKNFLFSCVQILIQ